MVTYHSDFLRNPALNMANPGTVDRTVPGFPRKERGLKMKSIMNPYP